MKIISPKIHGIIDYLVVIFLWAAPTVYGMIGEVAAYTYALGAIHLLLTILTDYSYGIFKFIPLPLHGLIELIAGIALVVIAYTLLKDDEKAKAFYTAFGIAVLIVFILTDYNGKKDMAKAPVL